MLPIGGAVTAALGVATLISASTFSAAWWLGVVLVIVGVAGLLPAFATLSLVTFLISLAILVTGLIVVLISYYLFKI